MGHGCSTSRWYSESVRNFPNGNPSPTSVNEGPLSIVMGSQMSSRTRPLRAGPQPFDALLDVLVVEVPLSDLAVCLDRRGLVALFFKGAGIPVGHLNALLVAFD